MDTSIRKNDNLDETVEDAYKETYCKDVTPILIKNANDHYMYVTVTKKLEIERLNKEHTAIDKKIAILSKKIENTQKEAEELDRKVFKASQIKNQTKVRFKTTGEIINVLKDEAEKLQNHSKKIETKRLDITMKVKEFAGKKKKNSEFKKRIEHLEDEIRQILNAPKIIFNEELLKENEKLKKQLTEKQEQFKIKHSKKQRIINLKEEKVNILTKINEKQEDIIKIKEKTEKKKKELEHYKLKMEQKYRDMEAKINNKILEKHDVMKNVEEFRKKSEEKQQLINDLKTKIGQTEADLEKCKKEVTSRQESIKKENEKFEIELEQENEHLIKVEKKLEDLMSENIFNTNALIEKIQTLNTLKTQKEELVARIYNQKIKILTQQHENLEEQSKIDNLSKILQSEEQQVNMLKSKNRELETKLEEVQKYKEEYPKDIEENRIKIETDYKDILKELEKKKNLNQATMEFIQNRLENGSKEVEKLKKEVKDYQEGNEWAIMKYEMRKRTVQNLKEKVKKEEAAYEKLLAELKQKEKVMEKTEEATEQENLRQNEKEPIKKVKAKSPMREQQTTEVVEDEDDEEKTMLSGRKSPGILKTSLKEQKRPQTPTKRVTFEGLSSTESSSMSIEAGVKNAEEETLNEYLKDWGNTSFGSNKSSKKVPMDF